MTDDKPEYGEKVDPEEATMMDLVALIPNEGDSIRIGNTEFTNHGDLVEADWAPVEPSEPTVIDLEDEDI